MLVQWADLAGSWTLGITDLIDITRRGLSVVVKELELVFLRSWSIRLATSTTLQSVKVLSWADARQKSFPSECANSLNNWLRHSTVSLDNKPQACSRWLQEILNNEKFPCWKQERAHGRQDIECISNTGWVTQMLTYRQGIQEIES